MRFLGKEVPKDDSGREMEFPSGNEPEEFYRRRDAFALAMTRRAKRRQCIVLSVVAAALVAMVGWQCYRR